VKVESVIDFTLLRQVLAETKWTTHRTTAQIGIRQAG